MKENRVKKVGVGQDNELVVPREAEEAENAIPNRFAHCLCQHIDEFNCIRRL